MMPANPKPHKRTMKGEPQINMERMTANRIHMSLSTAKHIRTITAPHFMAFALTTLLYIGMGSAAFITPVHYIEAIFTLTILPLLGYVLCRAVPSLKRKGRRLERTLAIVFSLLGYLLGVAFALIGGGTEIELTLYFTYLISGMLTAICSFVFKFKASGHACGASGPAAMLSMYLGPVYALSFAVLIPVYISSLKLERHTLGQLIAGTIVPILALIAATFIARAIVG